MRRILPATLCAVLTTLFIGVGTTPSLAHEFRVLGKYHFVVGWGDEPAYAGFKNSVQLLLADAADKPVNDLGDTLKVDVTFVGGASKSFPMEPNFEVGEFGTEGDYRAFFVPTRAGNYSFHFTGTVRGQKIDARFTSSDKTFDPVHETTEAEFPVKDPTVGEVSTKLDRETARLQTDLAAAIKKTRKDVDNAKMFGYAGLGLAAIATIIALARGRKKAA
jgi:hypothetical protein